MDTVRQVPRKKRWTLRLALGLLVLLMAGALLWQVQNRTDSFDTFIHQLAVDTLKDDPETQLYFGVEHVKGIKRDPTKLTDLSDADYKQLIETSGDHLKKLDKYDTAKLSAEDKLTYNILKWYLNAAQPVYEHWELHTNDYLSLVNFPPYFANNYPIRSQADAEHYITALNGFPDKVAHIIDRMQDRRESGYVPASEFLKEMLASYESLRNTKPEETILYSLYEEKLFALNLDSSEEKKLKSIRRPIRFAGYSAHPQDYAVQRIRRGMGGLYGELKRGEGLIGPEHRTQPSA